MSSSTSSRYGGFSAETIAPRPRAKARKRSRFLLSEATYRAAILGALVFASIATSGCCTNVKLTAAYAETNAQRNDAIAAVATHAETRAVAEANARWWRTVKPALLGEGGGE